MLMLQRLVPLLQRFIRTFLEIWGREMRLPHAPLLQQQAKPMLNNAQPMHGPLRRNRGLP